MARKLTARTALWKARDLLGRTATASVERCYAYEKRGKNGWQYLSCSGIHEQPCPMGRPVYRIGRIVMGMLNEIVGEGNTWEEALESVARREREEHERYLAAVKTVRERNAGGR